MTSDDRDEMIVELLTRILSRLDAVEEEIERTAKPLVEDHAKWKPVERKFLIGMAKDLGELKDHAAGIDAVAPVRRYIDDDAQRYENERSRMQARIDRLEHANQTWLWGAPALAIAALVLFVLGSRLAIHTVIGCTTFGGTYETIDKPGYVDLCLFAAGGWW